MLVLPFQFVPECPVVSASLLLTAMLPMYVNSSTSSIRALATDTPSPRLIPIRINFVLVALILRPKARVLSLISCILCNSRARSSEKSRFSEDVLKVRWIPLFPSKAVRVTQSRATRNGRGDSRQPCLTPVVISNGWVLCLLCTTFIESSDDGDHFVRHPVVPQQPPQILSADTIQGLYKDILYKDILERLPLNALLHNNPQSCYLTHTASASSEARARLFRSQFIIQRDLDALQDHSAKHLACHVPQHDATGWVALRGLALFWSALSTGASLLLLTWAIHLPRFSLAYMYFGTSHLSFWWSRTKSLHHLSFQPPQLSQLLIPHIPSCLSCTSSSPPYSALGTFCLHITPAFSFWPCSWCFFAAFRCSITSLVSLLIHSFLFDFALTSTCSQVST